MTREEYDRHLENAIAAGIQKNNEGSVIDSRTQFEQWISNAPFEREIKRWPADSAAYAWPGQYQDIAVEVAWEAWQQSAETSQTELKRLRDIIHRADVQFFHDGPDGETAAKMLEVLNEADKSTKGAS